MTDLDAYLDAVPTLTLLDYVLRRSPLPPVEIARSLGFPDVESMALWAVDAR